MKRSEAPVLSRQPGYAVVQTHRVLRHAMDDALRDLCLTTPQWGTLKCLQESEDLSGADMARMHHLTPQTMNTIIQNLEHLGLIEREHRSDHASVLRVCLTDLGRERLSQANECVAAVQRAMVSDLSESESELLMELLARCRASLSACPDGESSPASCPD